MCIYTHSLEDANAMLALLGIFQIGCREFAREVSKPHRKSRRQ